MDHHPKQDSLPFHSKRAASSVLNLVKFFQYHAYTAYLLSCNNINDIIISGYLFGIFNAIIAPRFSMGPARGLTHLLKFTPGMLIWSWSNLALFNLHNQRHGLAEDAINKPWRPLPSKRLTPLQATWAMYCMYPVVLIISLRFGGLVPCLFEAVCCLHYNEWNGSSDPFLKNLLNGLGFASFFAGPFEIATGHSILEGTATIWMMVIAAAITTVSHTQDFRDMDGDRQTGRKTVPLVIGDANARVLAGAGLLIWTGVACWFWEATWSGVLAWAMSVVMTWNLFKNRTKKGDFITWKMFPFWLAGFFLIPMKMKY